MKKLIVWCAALVIGSLVMGGCSSSRSNVTVHESTSISKGQELTDLQRALNEGGNTEREYESVRKVLLNRPY